jgi:hypothetical protein
MEIVVIDAGGIEKIGVFLDDLEYFFRDHA